MKNKNAESIQKVNHDAEKGNHRNNHSAELYGVSVAAINQHLKKVFEDGELTKEAVIKKKFYLKKCKCCACTAAFSGNGYREKYIIGQTPEGYIFAERIYCRHCGKNRFDYLSATRKLYSYQFDE